MKVFKVMSKRGSLLLVGLVLLVIMLFVSTVWAVETRSGDQVVIGPDDVIEDDLYVTASEILVEGTIRGDLVAFGKSALKPRSKARWYVRSDLPPKKRKSRPAPW